MAIMPACFRESRALRVLAEHHRRSTSVFRCRSHGREVWKNRSPKRQRGHWPWHYVNRRIPRWRFGLVTLFHRGEVVFGEECLFVRWLSQPLLP